jgi:hypothetical protein
MTSHTWPSDFELLGPLNNTWLAGDLQQTPMGSKLSPSSYRHLMLASSTSRHKLWCHDKTNTYMSMVTTSRSGVYHLLLLCNMYIDGECLVPCILKRPVFHNKQFHQPKYESFCVSAHQMFSYHVDAVTDGKSVLLQNFGIIEFSKVYVWNLRGLLCLVSGFIQFVRKRYRSSWEKTRQPAHKGRQRGKEL